MAHPGGRPKGAKTDHAKRDLQDMRDILHAIRQRKVDLGWVSRHKEQEARAIMYQDSMDLRTIVPALTPILTAHVELDATPQSLDISELIKAAANSNDQAPPALPAPSRPNNAFTPVSVLQRDDE